MDALAEVDTRLQAPGLDLGPVHGVEQQSKIENPPADVENSAVVEIPTSICEQCGSPFERRRSGGRPQRFCTEDCRRTFHAASEPQRQPTRPTPATPQTLPAILAAKPEASAIEPNDGTVPFSWNDDDSIILPEQPKTAAFINGYGGLVIRQINDQRGEDDIILIAQSNIGAFIDRLTDLVGIPSVGK